MKRIALALLAPAILIGCKANNPPLTGRVRPPAPAAAPKLEPRDFDKSYKYETSESTAVQNQYDANEISMNFMVSKGNESVQGLTEKDFRVTENGTQLTKFNIKASKEVSKKVVDIVFVVDITGSMGPFIASAKRVLKGFIEDSLRKGYHLRMCLSTFGDRVEKKCDRFFDNTSRKQKEEFLKELASLAIRKGQGEDPRFLDWEENSMRGLVEATKSEWAQDSQRFVLLVSDADFYSPDKPNKFIEQHQADPQFAAPLMKDVNAAITASQVTVFSITPPATGYNSPLNGEPDITATSKGQWFDFKQVMDRVVPLDSILQNILELVSVTYTLTYVVDENPGLNVTLPVEKRSVLITHVNGGKVEQGPGRSSMPDGRPQYKQTFKVSDSNIQQGSLKVWINGQPVNASDFTTQKGDVTFKTAPAPKSKLKFEFFYEDIEKNFRIEPLTFAGHIDSRNTKVYLNGTEARPEELEFTRDLEGNTSLRLSDSVMSANDPYHIRRNTGLKVRVVAY